MNEAFARYKVIKSSPAAKFYRLFFWVLFALGVFGLFAAGKGQYFPVFVLALTMGLVGVIIPLGRNKIILNCPCGYQGDALITGANIITAIILFLLGIIPGLLYLLICGPSRKRCPKCGREVVAD